MSKEAVPRYAPSDPTLPPPWRALVDATTGYIYYWNTETNATQYEKPMLAAPSQSPQVPSQLTFSSLSANVQVSHTEPRSGPSGNAHVNLPHAGGGSHLMNNSHVNGPPPAAAGGLSINSSHANGPQVGEHMMLNQGGHMMNGGGSSHTSRVPSNMYTNMNPMHVSGGDHVPGGGGQMHGGNIMSGNAYGGKGMPPHGSMVNGPMHSGMVNMNENPYGGSAMPSHGGIRDVSRGYPGANVGGNLPNVLSQPKLAVLPQRQQAGGGMHVTSQPSCQMNPPDPGNSTSSHLVSYKRPMDFNNNESDKRQRMQGLPETAPTLDADAYRRQHDITVSGENVPAPFITFDSANFPAELARELRSAGFAHPTPIQAQSWPLALQGRDIVAVAKTGSGKTLGYLLPAFLHLARQRANSQFGPIVLVLAPTRELATQIQDEAIKFGRSSRISCTCVYGGAPKGPQLRDLDRGSDIVIATPGRLNDFLEMKKVSLRQISYLVLDEADRMLDMGFEPQIRKIVKEIPSRRQTLMFTATWPKEVRKISAELLCNPIQVNIGNTDQLEANKSITQHVEVVPPFEKQRRLEQILRSQEPGSKIIIFCSTKKMCDQLARSLARGFGAAAIHGDKSQPERDHVLAQFKAGRTPILVATDVAARGLDVKDIRVVINFDFPTGVEDYVHRIGRTGRAGATGVAITFFGDQDSKYAKELIGVLEGANQKVPMELRDLASRPFYPKTRGRWESTGGGGGRDGGRDGSYGGFGGRGGGGGSGGRGSDGRGDGGSYGGRGAWGGSHFDRRERPTERYDNKDRLYDKSLTRDRYADERGRGRDASKRFGSKDRGRSYSRSYSRSRSRSRSRGRSFSRSQSRSLSRSRSRSNSYDRGSDDYNRRSPYRERGSRKNKLSRSRSRSRSPPASNHSPVKSKKGSETNNEKLSAICEDRYLPDMDPNTKTEDDPLPPAIAETGDDLKPGDVEA